MRALVVYVSVGVLAGCSAPPTPSGTAPTTLTQSASSPKSQSLTNSGLIGCRATQAQVSSLPASLDMGAHPYLWAGGDEFAAVLFYSRDGTSTLRSVPGTPKSSREGKFLWLVPNADAMNGPLTITGASQTPGQSFKQEIPGGGSYPSIVTIPSPGCWTLTGWLQGRRLGSLVIPVV